MTKFALAFLFAALAVAPIFIAQDEMRENGDGAAPDADPGPASGAGLWTRFKHRLGAD